MSPSFTTGVPLARGHFPALIFRKPDNCCGTWSGFVVNVQARGRIRKYTTSKCIIIQFARSFGNIVVVGYGTQVNSVVRFGTSAPPGCCGVALGLLGEFSRWLRGSDVFTCNDETRVPFDTIAMPEVQGILEKFHLFMRSTIETDILLLEGLGDMCPVVTSVDLFGSGEIWDGVLESGELRFG
mmetsp:Transcript_1375/g.3443  ORF Transcript_1375/g.3443 Transcript_1375/m.3443 type:complete len:183 (-) Transcript_1375:328-876(-)